MKGTRILVFALLIGLCGFGWFKWSADVVNEHQTIGRYIAVGRQYQEEGLYELAVNAYRNAIAADPSEENYDLLIAAYEEWYAEDGASVRKSLLGAYSEAASRYPKRVDYWERSAQNCLDNERYEDAVEVCERAMNHKASSETLTEIYRTCYYQVRRAGGSNVAEITRGALNSLYTFKDGSDGYGTFTASGGIAIDADEYVYVGPAGDSGVVLARDESGECFLLNRNGTKIARFAADVAEAKGLGDNCIPVRLEGREDWCYLDAQGEELFGGFVDASSFYGGSAVVQLSSGKWTVIDASGDQAGDTLWDGVLLNEGGSFVMDGCMMIQRDGTWILRDLAEGGAEVFAADALDISRGEAIAFEKGGKWGFVDRGGNVLIEPAYEEARSFSGGVAAVKLDGAWGFIDGAGRVVIEPSYAEAGYFDAAGGTCPVVEAEGEKWRLIAWVISHS